MRSSKEGSSEEIAHIEAPAFIGEASFLSGGGTNSASADVWANPGSAVVAWPIKKLDQMRSIDPTAVSRLGKLLGGVMSTRAGMANTNFLSKSGSGSYFRRGSFFAAGVDATSQGSHIGFGSLFAEPGKRSVLVDAAIT